MIDAATPPDGRVELSTTDDGSSLRGVGIATATLAIAVLAGQAVTVGREVFVAHSVGASARLDALLVALVAPLTVAGLLQSGTAAALVASVGALEATGTRSRALRLAGVVVTWTFILGAGLAGLVAILASPLVGLTGPGLGSDASALAVNMLPFVAPLVLLAPLGALGQALCQTGDRFRPIAVAAIANPITTTVCTIALWPALDVLALGVGMVAGAAVTVIVLGIGAARAGRFPRPSLRARSADVADFGRHAVPLWASSAGLTLNLASDRAVASLLTAGSISALRYGETIMRAPIMSIGNAWGTVAYPFLVRAAQATPSSLAGSAATLIRSALAIAVPVSVGAAALAPVIVDIAFERGAFDQAATAATALVILGMSPLFALSMVEAVLIGAHNARRAGVTLFAAGLTHAGVNLAFDLLLVGPLGVAGIAVATSLAYLAALSLLAVVLARQEPEFRPGPILSVAGRSTVASLVPGIPVGLVAWTLAPDASFLGLLGLLIGGSLVGLVGFLATARVLHITEVDEFVAAVVGRLPRITRR